jgi:hypothetical protein
VRPLLLLSGLCFPKPSFKTFSSPAAVAFPHSRPQQIYCKEPGNFNPRTAEMRADLGTAATDLSQYQTFDGPIPETVNGR